jgi:hypothetical protein
LTNSFLAISCSCQFRRLDPVLFRLLFSIPTALILVLRWTLIWFGSVSLIYSRGGSHRKHRFLYCCVTC